MYCTVTNRLPSVKWGVPRLAEMSAFPAGSDRVIESVRSLPVLAQMRSADLIEQCLISEAKRKTYARGEFFAI
jgi:hypothetical protein